MNEKNLQHVNSTLNLTERVPFTLHQHSLLPNCMIKRQMYTTNIYLGPAHNAFLTSNYVQERSSPTFSCFEQ